MIPTKQYVDAVQFLKDQVREIQASIAFAYPENHLEDGRAHGALQSIDKTAKAIESFLCNIKEKKTEE